MTDWPVWLQLAFGVGGFGLLGLVMYFSRPKGEDR